MATRVKWQATPAVTHRRRKLEPEASPPNCHPCFLMPALRHPNRGPAPCSKWCPRALSVRAVVIISPTRGCRVETVCPTSPMSLQCSIVERSASPNLRSRKASWPLPKTPATQGRAQQRNQTPNLVAHQNPLGFRGTAEMGSQEVWMTQWSSQNLDSR